MKIKTVRDVFDHFGADFDESYTLEENNKNLSRRVYKDTACGAWAEVRERVSVEIGREAQVWVATFQKSIVGYVLIGLRREHKRKLGISPGTFALIPEVRDYLQVDYVGGRWVFTDEAGTTLLDEIQPDGDNLRVTRRGLRLTVTFRVTVAVRKDYAGAFYCGSIVEGTDAEVNAEPVYLPCEAVDLDRAIEYVEERVDEVWKETHGCEKCFGGDGAGPGGPVDPDCKSCKGEGTVI